MNKEEKNDRKEMLETIKILAKNDPQGFVIIKSNAEILKARYDMEMAEKQEVLQPV